MPKPRLSDLVEAMRQERLVRLSRRFESSRVGGYILDVGPRFFLLALVSDRLWLDGFECFRTADVKALKPDPYASFAEAALKKRGEQKPQKPKVSVESAESILLSATEAFPLLTIHREEAGRGICHIGRVMGTKQGVVDLLEIRPDATWEGSPRQYRLSEITRINFGGDYEDALHIVAGDGAG